MQCRRCQYDSPPNAKFCGECGAVLVVADDRYPTPDRYARKTLPRGIPTAKNVVEGERKLVTVLFADMKGSMELLADRDPEEARSLLDPVLELMIEAVHRYTGTVNQILGDGIMALFGAPLAYEDHALRACYAALSMQESVLKYGTELQRRGAPPVQVRVGLNSGEVVVRSISSDLRVDYTAIGQTTHLASRVEQIAKPESILITRATLQLVRGYVEVKALGEVSVKGLDQSIEVYELVGPGQARSRLQAAAARGLTRFVGRDREIDALDRARQQCETGHGQIVAVVGEAGVGKSRLLREFAQSVRLLDWLVLEAQSISYGQATPYLPLADLLREYFHVGPDTGEREIRERVVGRLLSLTDDLGSAVPAFLTLLDIQANESEWHSLDPSERRRHTLSGLKQLLLAESYRQPVLLVVEDLHWTDSETHALLDDLVDALSPVRLLLLVTYRPEHRDSWATRSHYTRIDVEPLTAESAAELLDALLGPDPGLHQLKQMLIERTEGNPFFLEESVRTLIDSRTLVGSPEAYRLAQTPERIHVPPSVHAVLASRIDRLPPDERHILQSAAVIGRDVPLSVLQAIAELPEERLQRGLVHLHHAEFLYETRLFPVIEYSFKHALTMEVAYSGLLHERRKALHARTLQVLEALRSERVEDLAHHAFHGELWAKAATYFWEAGAKAATRSAHREAVALFEQALVALKQLPESRQIIEQAIDLRFELRNALHPLGEFGTIVSYLREAETLALNAGDQRRLGRVSAYLTQYFWWLGDPDQAIESGHRALSIAKELDDFVLHVVATFGLGVVHHSLGDYDRAIDVLQATVDSLRGDLLHERFGLPGPPSVFFRVWLVQCFAELGEFAKASALGEEALTIAEGVDRPFSRIQAHYGLAFLYLRQSKLDRAIPILERALSLCETWNILIWFPRIASALGYAKALSGRTTEALPLLERAVAQATSRRILFGHSLAVAWLGEAYLLAGRFEEATTHAEHALALAREHKERGYEAWAWRLFARIKSRQDRASASEIERCYAQSRSLAEELGMRPLIAHCHQGLGTLYQETGRLAEASEQSAMAARLFRELEMPLASTSPGQANPPARPPLGSLSR